MTVTAPEFAIAPIPLGGFVSMLDEREAPVPEHLQEQAFNPQKSVGAHRHCQCRAAGQFYICHSGLLGFIRRGYQRPGAGGGAGYNPIR